MSARVVQRGVWWLIIAATGVACVVDVLVRPALQS